MSQTEPKVTEPKESEPTSAVDSLPHNVEYPQSGYSTLTRTALDIRVFNAICALVLMLAILVFLINLVAESHNREIIYSSVAALISGLCWYLSVKHQKTDQLRIPIFLFFFALLILTWTTNQGYEGSSPYFMFLCFSAGIVILKPSYRWQLLILAGVLVAALFVISWVDPSFIHPYANAKQQFLDVFLSFVACALVNSMLIWIVVEEYQAEKNRNELLIEQVMGDKIRLESLLEEVRVLKGILPVCSYCKKIRDEQNNWQTMEHYISSRTDAQFSHSFCPDCGHEHFPDVVQKQ